MSEITDEMILNLFEYTRVPIVGETWKHLKVIFWQQSGRQSRRLQDHE
ncbi:hypothetical protein [Sporomusa termitida]|nr:hypothetical protein [Sporomusa termitida]